jgi:hypothetical protein
MRRENGSVQAALAIGCAVVLLGGCKSDGDPKSEVGMNPDPVLHSTPTANAPSSAPAASDKAPVPATSDDKPWDGPPVSASPFSATPIDEWVPKTVDEARSEANTSFDACHHWGGEEPYDDGRAQEIATGQKRDCTRSISILIQARKAFPNDAILSAIGVDLMGYVWPDHGARDLFKSARDLEKACQRASDLYADGKRSESYARSVCTGPDMFFED